MDKESPKARSLKKLLIIVLSHLNFYPEHSGTFGRVRVRPVVLLLTKNFLLHYKEYKHTHM